MKTPLEPFDNIALTSTPRSFKYFGLQVIIISRGEKNIKKIKLLTESSKKIGQSIARF